MNGVTRRAFLRGGLGAIVMGAGGCVGLPFACRPRKDETLTAILSDCHVGGWNSPKYQGVRFAECVARVLALDPLPARMIIPGDLAYLWGRKEDYALSRQLLQPVLDAGIALTIGMGNHDRRENFLECWPEYAVSPVPGRVVGVTHGAYFDFVMIDTLDQPEATDRWITPGAFDERQREWLRCLCRAEKRPHLVFAHHPAGELGEPGKGCTERSARIFGEVLMGERDEPTMCRGFIHGHDHRWYLTRSLLHWSDPRIGQTASLPSTGHWGDIGFALLREYPDRAELALVQYDYFSPSPPQDGSEPNPAWRAVVRDNADARCTFVV